jgi:hypothetical protein
VSSASIREIFSAVPPRRDPTSLPVVTPPQIEGAYPSPAYPIAAQQDCSVSVYDGETLTLVVSHQHHDDPVATLRAYTARDGVQKIMSAGWGSRIIISDPEKTDLQTIAFSTSDSFAWSSVAFRADRQLDTTTPGCVPRPLGAPGGCWHPASMMGVPNTVTFRKGSMT